MAAEEIGETMRERVAVYRQLLAQTPVDELDVKEEPSVIFRVNENTWIDAIVRYLVIPKEQGRVKTRLNQRNARAFQGRNAPCFPGATRDELWNRLRLLPANPERVMIIPFS